MKLLILGGNGFLGRALVRAAQKKGWEVTCLARGTDPMPPGAAFVQADREHPAALDSIADTRWDAVVDLTSHPGQARRAARRIRAQHTVFVSTASVYADPSMFEPAESAVLHEPLEADALTEMQDYGAAKAACESAYRDASTALTVIRPGLIGGSGDATGRTGYYPWRFAHATGADVLVPDLSFPVSIIDVEDLAEWALSCAEGRVVGTFNAGGETTTLGDVVETSRQLTRSTVSVRSVSDADLLEAGVSPWMGPGSLPLWIPGPAYRNAATLDSSSARSEGLHSRPMASTLEAAWRYEEERGGPLGAGLSDAEEIELRRVLDSARRSG